MCLTVKRENKKHFLETFPLELQFNIKDIARINETEETNCLHFVAISSPATISKCVRLIVQAVLQITCKVRSAVFDQRSFLLQL